ncbi:trypco2 family protein [Streptomyces sp. NPDC048637]|uniref:trypco2 family protein n=1 Tax=Streptomyces sp. NPDC048637 TaxID=3155636 RepID=UPI00342DE67F
MESGGTELAEALKAVREGLAAAQRDGEGSLLRFRVSDADTASIPCRAKWRWAEDPSERTPSPAGP